MRRKQSKKSNQYMNLNQLLQTIRIDRREAIEVLIKSLNFLKNENATKMNMMLKLKALWSKIKKNLSQLQTLIQIKCTKKGIINLSSPSKT